MLDIGWTELLVIAVILIVVVGPKDLPPMLRAFGKMTANLRKMAGDFRTQFDEALREADMDDVRKTISDAQRFHPANALREAINPLRQMGNDIRSDLQKATSLESATGGTAATDMPTDPAELSDGLAGVPGLSLPEGGDAGLAPQAAAAAASTASPAPPSAAGSASASTASSTTPSPASSTMSSTGVATTPSTSPAPAPSVAGSASTGSSTGASAAAPAGVTAGASSAAPLGAAPEARKPRAPRKQKATLATQDTVATQNTVAPLGADAVAALGAASEPASAGPASAKPALRRSRTAKAVDAASAPVASVPVAAEKPAPRARKKPAAPEDNA